MDFFFFPFISPPPSPPYFVPWKAEPCTLLPMLTSPQTSSRVWLSGSSYRRGEWGRDNNSFFIFKIFFFLMWTIFKVLIEFFTTMLLFHVLVFWLWSMWDLSLLTRNWSLNHWTTGEIPIKIPFYSCGINRSRAEGLSFSTSALCAWVPEPTSTLTPQGRPTAYSYEAYSVVTFLVLFPHFVHTFMSCPLLHSNCPIQALLLFPAEIWTQENSEKGLYMLTVEKGLPR